MGAGASYLGISDHSQSVRYAGGLLEEDLARQAVEIDEGTRKHDDLRVAKAEVDILPDGTLDYPDGVLERLDFVVASVHTHLEDGRGGDDGARRRPCGTARRSWPTPPGGFSCSARDFGCASTK